MYIVERVVIDIHEKSGMVAGFHTNGSRSATSHAGLLHRTSARVNNIILMLQSLSVQSFYYSNIPSPSLLS